MTQYASSIAFSPLSGEPHGDSLISLTAMGAVVEYTPGSPADGDTIVVDVEGRSSTLEYDNSGVVTAGRTRIPIGADNHETARNTADAINGLNFPILVRYFPVEASGTRAPWLSVAYRDGRTRTAFAAFTTAAFTMPNLSPTVQMLHIGTFAFDVQGGEIPFGSRRVGVPFCIRNDGSAAFTFRTFAPHANVAADNVAYSAIVTSEAGGMTRAASLTVPAGAVIRGYLDFAALSVADISSGAFVRFVCSEVTASGRLWLGHGLQPISQGAIPSEQHSRA